MAALSLLLMPQLAAAQQMQTMTPGQAALIQRLLPTVVNINSFVTNLPPETPAVASLNGERPGPKMLQGSGFIIDPSGVILSNFHVVDGAYDIYVTLSDGTRIRGMVSAIAPCIDLALIKIDVNHPLPVVAWGDSDKLLVGDAVFAIGNPLGVGLSVSGGIVSGLNRNLKDTPFDDFIQTDAAINHGNSGGPLFDRDGKVVGVDTAILSPTTGSVGLGFAIPSADAHYVANRLLRDSHIDIGYIGATFEGVSSDIAAALGLQRPTGAIVTSVPQDSPAQAAGLEVGDVVTDYDSADVSDDRALRRDIVRSALGRTVSMTVARDGQTRTLQVTPVDYPNSETSKSAVPSSLSAANQVPPNLGLTLAALTTTLRAKYSLMMQQPGVLVSGVTAGTDAYERGLVPGDVILRVQDTVVKTPADIQAAVDAARASHRQLVLFLVRPSGKPAQTPEWIALRVSAS